MADLTEETIRSTTQSGDTPLHRAAKNGGFADIPSNLLQIELFMASNNRRETPLHIAAKHGHLNQVPPSFLTIQTLTVLDYHGRSPLHIAASYRHVDQIPPEFLTVEILSLRTENYRSDTVLHLAAETNTLHRIPKKHISSEVLAIRNGYGLTPLEVLKAHLPTQGQLFRLRELEIQFDESDLTRERAAGLIEVEENRRKAQKATRAAKPPSRIRYREVNPSHSSIALGPTERIILLAKSSSGGTPYKVEFLTDGPSLRVMCHCPAGRRGSLCRHIVALGTGDAEMLFDSEQSERFAELQCLPQFGDLKIRIDSFLDQ